MPQLAVCRNPRRNEDVPFVVQVQYTRLDRSVGRVVVPLPFVFADVLSMAMLPSARLRRSLLVLDESNQDRVIRVIDEMISRA